jgi:tetratricopeptide (TPR) repeat protein
LNISQADTGKPAVEQFFEANQAYKNNQFQLAAEGYLRLIEAGFENGHLYYNLGNTYFRLGELGKAVLYYERAALLIPRDDDLAFNLSNARNQTQDDVPYPEVSSINTFLGLDSINLYEALFAFTLLYIIFFSILCFRLFKKPEWLYYLSIFLAIMISVGAVAFVLKWYGTVNDNRAVVLVKELEVRAGPDTKDTLLFKIHEGTIVHYDRVEDGWVLMRLSKDKRGWVRDNQLERILSFV